MIRDTRARMKPTPAHDVERFKRHASDVLRSLAYLPSVADEWAAGATDTVLGMLERAEAGMATPKMRHALLNIEAAAERWEQNR